MEARGRKYDPDRLPFDREIQSLDFNPSDEKIDEEFARLIETEKAFEQALNRIECYEAGFQADIDHDIDTFLKLLPTSMRPKFLIDASGKISNTHKVGNVLRQLNDREGECIRLIEKYANEQHRAVPAERRLKLIKATAEKIALMNRLYSRRS